MISSNYVDGLELRIKELTAERNAALAREAGLVAQVEALREFAELIVEWKEYGFEKAKTLLDSTPAQCLAEIKAQAGRDGFIAGARAMRSHGPFNIIREADEYSDEILAQAENALEYTGARAENEALNHFVEANKMVLRQFTVYEWREIGETDWVECEEEWFVYCQLSANCDTRKRLLSVEEVKTNAFKQGFDACINASVKMGMIDEDGEFANQLRQQAKGE